MSKLEELYSAVKETEDALCELSRKFAAFSGENSAELKQCISDITSSKRSILQVKATVKAKLDRAAVTYIKNHDRYHIIANLMSGKMVDPKTVDQKELMSAIQLINYSCTH